MGALAGLAQLVVVFFQTSPYVAVAAFALVLFDFLVAGFPVDFVAGLRSECSAAGNKNQAAYLYCVINV